MSKPIISVVIATLNAERTLELCLDSLNKQVRENFKLEIYVIDGGSIDKTIKIAQSYMCTILYNERIHPIFAKDLAFKKINSKFILFLDSDEIIVNANYIEKLLKIAETNPLPKIVIPAGYTPGWKQTRFEEYINLCGDCFSYFVHRHSKIDTHNIEFIKNKHRVIYEGETSIVFEINQKKGGIFEPIAGGTLVNAQWIKKNLNISSAGKLGALNRRQNQDVGPLGCDKELSLKHLSATGINSVFMKTRSRVIANLYSSDIREAGVFGFSKRQGNGYLALLFRFSLYTLSLASLVEGFCIYRKTRNIVFLLHPLFCFSVFYFFLTNAPLAIFRTRKKIAHG